MKSLQTNPKNKQIQNIWPLKWCLSKNVERNVGIRELSMEFSVTDPAFFSLVRSCSLGCQWAGLCRAWCQMTSRTHCTFWASEYGGEHAGFPGVCLLVLSWQTDWEILSLTLHSGSSCPLCRVFILAGELGRWRGVSETHTRFQMGV